jgi:hypothetical protein
LRRSGKGEKGRCLPWSKEEEGAYIFWMKQVPVQCKPKDVQSLQSSYFLVFYHFRFETTTLTFSRIIDFDDTTNLFLKQVYSCAVVDTYICLIWTDLLILISRPVHWDKFYQSTHCKGKLHKLPISSLSYHFSPFENENYHRFVISLQANNLTSLSPYATDLQGTSDR